MRAYIDLLRVFILILQEVIGALEPPGYLVLDENFEVRA